MKVARQDAELHLHTAKICHIVMMKVEWICTGRTKKCSVFMQGNENSFGNLPEECIIDRDLLGPKTRNKNFDLSMFNRIIPFMFHF